MDEITQLLELIVESQNEKFLGLGDFWWTVASSIATIIGLLIAVVSILITARNVNKSQEPQLEVYLSSIDPENVSNSQGFMLLNIENFGPQTATNIKLKFDDNFPTSLFHKNLDSEGNTTYSFIESALFKQGISSIAPSQKTSFLAFNLVEINNLIKQGKDIPKLEINISWKHRSRTLSKKSVIDLKDYVLQVNQVSPMAIMNKNLKDLSKNSLSSDKTKTKLLTRILNELVEQRNRSLTYKLSRFLSKRLDKVNENTDLSNLGTTDPNELLRQLRHSK